MWPFSFSQPLLHHCMQLKRHKVFEWENELKYEDTDEMELDNLATYDNIVNEVEHQKSLVDSEQMATENCFFSPQF